MSPATWYQTLGQADLSMASLVRPRGEGSCPGTLGSLRRPGLAALPDVPDGPVGTLYCRNKWECLFQKRRVPQNQARATTDLMRI